MFGDLVTQIADFSAINVDESLRATNTSLLSVEPEIKILDPPPAPPGTYTSIGLRVSLDFEQSAQAITSHGVIASGRSYWLEEYGNDAVSTMPVKSWEYLVGNALDGLVAAVTDWFNTLVSRSAWRLVA